MADLKNHLDALQFAVACGARDPKTVLMFARDFLAFLDEGRPAAPDGPLERVVNEKAPEKEVSFAFAETPDDNLWSIFKFGSFMWMVDVTSRGRTVTRAAGGPQPRILMKDGILQTRDNRPFLPMFSDFMSTDWRLA